MRRGFKMAMALVVLATRKNGCQNVRFQKLNGNSFADIRLVAMALANGYMFKYLRGDIVIFIA